MRIERPQERPHYNALPFFYRAQSRECIGYSTLSRVQLKILREVITLAVFYMGQGLKMDFLYAGLCLLGAVYFIFLARAARSAAVFLLFPR